MSRRTNVKASFALPEIMQHGDNYGEKSERCCVDSDAHSKKKTWSVKNDVVNGIWCQNIDWAQKAFSCAAFHASDTHKKKGCVI